MSAWRAILAWLASVAADPADLDREYPRAAAAVSAAYASMAPGTPTPAPEPSSCACGGRCQSGVYRPDGRIEMRCEGDCGCGCQKATAAAEKCSCSAERGQKGG